MAERLTSVLLDGVVFENSCQRGIQRYYFEMLKRLPADQNCTFVFNRPYEIPPPPGIKVILRSELFPVSPRAVLSRARRKMKHLLGGTRLPESSVFHSTYFTRSPVAGLPEVVTVHDLIPECRPEQYADEVEKIVARKRECIVNAAAIIAISQATRDDLARIYPEVASRVTVIHHGADHLPDAGNEIARAGHEPPYVLFVGDRAGYKNFASVIAALAERGWPSSVKLKVAGQKFTEAEQRLLQQHGVGSKVIHAGRVTDLELRQLYQRAAAFVFPSLCEGFGFPLLEAQQMRVPVLASDIPVFREIGGDGVLFFKPHSPAEIAAAVLKVLEPEEHERRVLAGVENARRFTWENCAQKTAAVFRAAANGR